LLRIVEESRFIASTDLYQVDGRHRQNLKVLVSELRRAKLLPIVSSAGRLGLPTFFPTKTYIYGAGLRGQIVHWLYIAHLRALFTRAARDLAVPLAWKQSNKHDQLIPDAEILLPSGSYSLEVDNSTEGMRLDRIAGKISDRTLVVAFRSEVRFQNLAALGGLSTYHGYFHEKEEEGFNILTEPIWWDGDVWRSLI
jgi:hypothetical protein